MKEYTELRVSNNEIILDNNIVRSGILPQSSSELSRDIRIKTDVEIEGGVFGNKIEIEGGNAVFDGAVYANSELYIANSVSAGIYFKKAVGCSDTISAFISSSNNKVIFGSDINAKKVRLKNCYVGGSIFAQEISLENCVVLGGVFASKTLSITKSMFGTFHAPSVELRDINYLLYPACFSVEPVSGFPGAELYNLSLANLGALYKGEKEAPNTGKIVMSLDTDSQRTVLVDENEATIIVNSYSVSGRVLAADMIDLDKLENHFLIEAGSLGTQLLKVYSLSKEDGSRSDELTVANIADFMFGIVNGAIQIQDLSGKIDFAELRKIFA